MTVKELVTEIAKILVDNPGEVTVREVAGEQVTVLELRVAPADLGKVIGKQGRTARSLRTILGAASMKLHHRFALDIVEDRDQMGRVYLPIADIERFDCRPDLSGPEDAVIGLLLYESARAQAWYDEGLQLLPILDRRSRACFGCCCCSNC